MSKPKALFNGRSGSPQPTHHVSAGGDLPPGVPPLPPLPPGGYSELQMKDLQHRMQLLQVGACQCGLAGQGVGAH